MAATDYDAAAVKAAIKAAVPGIDDSGDAPTLLDRLTGTARAAVAAELGVRDPGEDWDPDMPPDVVREACIRTAAYLWQSRPRIGSRQADDRTPGGGAVRASGARALLMAWRTPGVEVAS